MSVERHCTAEQCASWTGCFPQRSLDTVWTVSCRGIFVVQYLNDFGGDFIISIDGNENLRVSGEDSRVTKLYFPNTRNCVDDCECEDWEQEGAVLVGL